MSAFKVRDVPVASFLAMFVPNDVISDLHRAQLTEDVCPGLRFIDCYKSEESSSEPYNGSCSDTSVEAIELGSGSLDDVLERCFSCHHSVIFHLVTSMSTDGTETARILRSTRTSVHATPRFKSRSTPWLTQFASRFATLIGAHKRRSRSKDNSLKQLLDPGWIGEMSPVRLIEGGHEVIGGEIPPTFQTTHSYYAGVDLASKEIKVLRVGPWTIKESKTRQTSRHLHDLRDIKGPILPRCSRTVVQIMGDVIEANGKADDGYNIIHGDIAPQNIVRIRGDVGALVDWEDGRSVKFQQKERYKQSLKRFERQILYSGLLTR